MDVVDAILGRRSIRRGFRPDPVSPDVIGQVLECGLHAPASKNDQP